MSIPLFNSIASWLLKKRYHQIELFLKYPEEVQQEVLMQLLAFAKDTEIGRMHEFGSILSYRTFASRVPVTSYEEMEPNIERTRRGEQNIFWPTSIKWFAKSSGTTNAKSKFIPVSTEALEDCHYKSGKDLLCLYLNNNENSQLFTGKSLRLGGSKELYEDNGTFFGDLSAILIDNMPFWAELSSTPSNKVSLMSEWESKLKAIIKESTQENVTSLAGVPSWMLVLMNNVIEETGKDHLFQVWENLEVYFHGGVSFNPYKEQYKKLLPRKSFNYYEIYNASEGFFAIQDRNNSDELLLMLDYGIFYEFIAMDTYYDEVQKIVPLWEVEKNKNYAIIITTNAGLWRYKIGDTIKFTSISPYRIKVTGRTKHHINVFGEELIIENAEEALQNTCLKTGAEIKDYTAGPIFMAGTEKGGHEWIIEFRKPPKELAYFTEILDNALKSLNSDYEAKRYNNITLKMPKVHIARHNLFYDWLKLKDKLGGQHKIPRLSNKRDYVEELLGMNQ
ncbi:GH3 auxin-responsive promoter family protein [Cellulophaga sp. E16_2]|uniref:GH3 auxin-responsive promoter n=1 Tax=Cellulophaga algicola (strain DSM 14237 / IC166 / ACAM 630) TaxID=688270 RepID=E6X583_CELAD|nr:MULTISPECIES: GH3 auxin-responsive promoter family protein [Cellulophaga]ADV49419.1 GH3 auxin-responsive promoter [Cellulophaga algicola DSM 14237]MBO0591872.1 GH3 auxin-responsive promoter family protein [Cellulophaga sp. E16_2]